jgi:hypothetical protein
MMTKPSISIGSIKINNMTGNASITIGEMVQKNAKYEDQSQGTNCSIGDSSSVESIMENKQIETKQKEDSSSSSQPGSESDDFEEEAATGIYSY